MRYMMISNRFKLIRKSNGYTQIEFAKVLNCTQSCISDYEKGRNNIPDTIKEKLFNMGFNINWLISGKGNMLHNETNAYNEIAINERIIKQKKLKALLKNVIDLLNDDII